jgi:hypothetical protein
MYASLRVYKIGIVLYPPLFSPAMVFAVIIKDKNVPWPSRKAFYRMVIVAQTGDHANG